MEDIIDQVRDYMEEDEWRYEFDEERKLIRANINLKCKLKSVRMVISFNESGYTVYVIPNLKSEKESLNDVQEYITRANYGVRNGNFEMDLEDGEVRYKLYVNTRGMKEIPLEIIDDSLKMPALMVDKYGDGLSALMLGFSDPVTEIYRVEYSLKNP